ncbi:hypothetical protein SAY86_031884 [Trapa natans]|uniref:Uncharacterized protein n=1 Tax=Trapa natans TaxID=22666 RepID=A0AAN7LS41_TRANT|nr:hypothetical protein SAY86_031884 [Trapa natans]
MRHNGAAHFGSFTLPPASSTAASLARESRPAGGGSFPLERPIEREKRRRRGRGVVGEGEKRHSIVETEVILPKLQVGMSR